MRISLSYSEVNEILVSWVKSRLKDLPENAEFDVRGSSYGSTEIVITSPEPTPPPVEEKEVA